MEGSRMAGFGFWQKANQALIYDLQKDCSHLADLCNERTGNGLINEKLPNKEITFSCQRKARLSGSHGTIRNTVGEH